MQVFSTSFAYAGFANAVHRGRLCRLSAGSLPIGMCAPKATGKGKRAFILMAEHGVSVYFPYSGPFFICLTRMLISTTSSVVNKAKKRKNVVAMEAGLTSLTATHVGSMSWMVQG